MNQSSYDMGSHMVGKPPDLLNPDPVMSNMGPPHGMAASPSKTGVLGVEDDVRLDQMGSFSDEFVNDFARRHWEMPEAETQLPSYLMTGLLSPTNALDVDYTPGQFDNHQMSVMSMPDHQFNIKQEPHSPSVRQRLQNSTVAPAASDKRVQEVKRATRSRRGSAQVDSPTGPLVSRQKRQSDDDGDSNDSMASDAFSDGTDGGSGQSNESNPNGLPTLPRISTSSFSEHKRQRKDVSMSAPAVAARELRQKKKQREEQLITECQDLKNEAESIDREMNDVKHQLERLREDAAYLRSLVKSQDSTIALLQYLQQAPFFKSEGKQLNLDARTMLRQISGSDDFETAEERPKKEPTSKDIGGICLHINGSNITLHLCSHCSSEASSQ